MSATVYRPSRAFGLFLVAVHVATSALLFFLGFVLDASSTEAMDGFERLLFTVIPIRPFAWVMAVVFLGLGLATVRRVFFGRPTLLLAEDGLETRDGHRITWKEVGRVDVLDDKALRLLVTRPDHAPETVEIGQFGLGTGVTVVAEEIERHLGSSPADPDPDADG